MSDKMYDGLEEQFDTKREDELVVEEELDFGDVFSAEVADVTIAEDNGTDDFGYEDPLTYAYVDDDVTDVEGTEEEVEEVDDIEEEFIDLGLEDEVEGIVDEVYDDSFLDELVEDVEEFDEFGNSFVDENGAVRDFEFDIDDIDEDEIVQAEVLYDAKGSPVKIQLDGEMKIKHIPLDLIDIPPRARQFGDVAELEANITEWGLLEPIHVIPYKDRFILVHGYRRVKVFERMNRDIITAIVDTTRPKETVRYLEVLANRSVAYNFIEMMDVGAFIEERQKSFSHDTIENILGLPSGAYLKAKYIEAAKHQFEDVYMKVVRGKMTIDLAFKKIEKELNKEEEDLSPLDHLNKYGLPGDEYGKVEEEPDYVQTKGERHTLDPALRKYVEGRDHHSCQSCGMGLGVPDFATLFHVHHMIPVKHGGPDKKGNLILLCQNCHAMVHGYDEGRFKPNADLTDEFDVVHNAVLLGNIVKKGLPVDYVGEAYEFYMDRARQFWLDVDAYDEYVDGEYGEDFVDGEDEVE